MWPDFIADNMNQLRLYMYMYLFKVVRMDEIMLLKKDIVSDKNSLS